MALGTLSYPADLRLSTYRILQRAKLDVNTHAACASLRTDVGMVQDLHYPDFPEQLLGEER